MLAAVQQEQAEGRLGRPSARVVAALPARVRAVQRHQRTARTRWRIARDLIAVFTKSFPTLILTRLERKSENSGVREVRKLEKKEKS